MKNNNDKNMKRAKEPNITQVYMPTSQYEDEVEGTYERIENTMKREGKMLVL